MAKIEWWVEINLCSVKWGGRVGEQPFLAGPNYEKTFHPDEKPKRLRTAALHDNCTWSSLKVELYEKVAGG